MKSAFVEISRYLIRTRLARSKVNVLRLVVLADKCWEISCIKVRQSSLLPHIHKDLIFDFSGEMF